MLDGRATHALVPSPARRRAFSLIEVLVVLAIIASLAAILLPGVSMIKEAARKSQCANNLRQVFVAAMVWGQSNGGRTLPESYAPLLVSVADSATIMRKNFLCPKTLSSRGKPPSPTVTEPTLYGIFGRTVSDYVTNNINWVNSYGRWRLNHYSALGSVGYFTDYYPDLINAPNRARVDVWSTTSYYCLQRPHAIYRSTTVYLDGHVALTDIFSLVSAFNSAPW